MARWNARRGTAHYVRRSSGTNESRERPQAEETSIAITCTLSHDGIPIGPNLPPMSANCVEEVSLNIPGTLSFRPMVLLPAITGVLARSLLQPSTSQQQLVCLDGDGLSEHPFTGGVF